MDGFTIGNSLSKLSMLETWHPRTDEDLASISSERLTPGERLLECYTVESDALRGGMGSVWRVRYDALDKPLAMKRPQPRFFAEASVEVKERFIHECEAWIGLGLHPNIVACYYVRDIGGVPSIFAEWMAGGSLEKRIRDSCSPAGKTSPARSARLRCTRRSAGVIPRSLLIPEIPACCRGSCSVCAANRRRKSADRRGRRARADCFRSSKESEREAWIQMSKRKSDGTAVLVIVFILVLAFLVGIVVFATHTYVRISRQSKADEATLKAWMEVWENGEAVTGIVAKIKDKAVRDSCELRYTVDGTDYAVACTLNGKTFAAIDGDDGDGQAEVEIHYDPNDPQVATSEAALEGQKELGKNNSVGMMLMTAAILFVLFGIVTEIWKKVRLG